MPKSKVFSRKIAYVVVKNSELELTRGWLTVMQVLQTLRLMVMVVVVGRPHRRTHGVVAVLMVRRAPPMRMILGGMMLMRMIGGRQEGRRRRVNAGAVTGRPAECCYRTINTGAR